MKAKYYSTLLSEINGYEILKNIYERSKVTENKHFMPLCERTLNLFENESKSERDIDFENNGQKSESENSENDHLIEAEYSKIIDSLRRYKHLPNYVRKALHRILDHKLNYFKPSDSLVDFVIDLMKIHSETKDLQLYAIVFLQRLTKHELSDRLDIKRLEKVVDLTMNAMETLPNDQNLQRYSLSILGNDRILNDVTFDTFKCIQLVMDTMVSFEDKEMNEAAICISSILSGKLSIVEKTNLFAKTIYLEILLNIIEKRVELASDNDIVLELTLIILSRLNNSSYEMFIGKGGINLYFNVLKVNF